MYVAYPVPALYLQVTPVPNKYEAYPVPILYLTNDSCAK